MISEMFLKKIPLKINASKLKVYIDAHGTLSAEEFFPSCEED